MQSDAAAAPRPRNRLRRQVARGLAAVLVSTVAPMVAAPLASPAAAACDGASLSAAQLTAAFANPGLGAGGGVAGYAGGDYQRVYPLPDGRQLWLFQDMFFSNDNDLRDSLTFAAHNAGLVQNGTCWSLVGGPKMNNFIGKAQTQPLRTWFWAMDGEIGFDGALWIFMVEMRNPNGTGATWGAAPAGTWVARIDPATLQVLSFTLARDPGPRLFGWSVVSDDEWSYLYGQCYRQFINVVNGPGQFDKNCTQHTYLARVPKGRFDQAPMYWNRGTWSPNWWDAQPLMTRDTVNAMGVQRFGDVYVNVTKADDWWGAVIHVDKAPNPWGPWEPAQNSIWIVDLRRCSQCGIYHAHLLPYLDSNGQMILSWSNGGPFNLWQANAWLYRPTFVNVPLPTFRADPPVGDLVLRPQTLQRAFDSRSGGARLAGGTQRVIPLAGFTPAGAVGVVANLTVTDTSSAGTGFVTAWPCGSRMPTASVLNMRPGRSTANGMHIRLDPQRRICVYASRDTEVIVDVVGAYVPAAGNPTGLGLHPLPPTTIASTADPGGPTGGQPLAANGTINVPVLGVGGVPDAAATPAVGAVTVTVTATPVSARGFVTVWPCGSARPTVSTLNVSVGETAANSVTVAPGSNGEVCVFANVSVDVDVAVVGHWTTAGARARLMSPVRVLDTRAGPPVAAGAGRVVNLSAVAGTAATAAIANLTVVQPSSAGAAVWHDCSAAAPTAPTLRLVGGEVRAGVGVAKLDPDDQACVTTTVSAHLVADLMVSFEG